MFQKEKIAALKQKVSDLEFEIGNLIRVIQNVGLGKTDAEQEMQIQRDRHPKEFAAHDRQDAFVRSQLLGWATNDKEPKDG